MLIQHLIWVVWVDTNPLKIKVLVLNWPKGASFFYCTTI
jgi:hypothetical protein